MELRMISSPVPDFGRFFLRFLQAAEGPPLRRMAGVNDDNHQLGYSIGERYLKTSLLTPETFFYGAGFETKPSIPFDPPSATFPPHQIGSAPTRRHSQFRGKLNLIRKSILPAKTAD